MNALRKDFVREIRHTFSRFLSILILVTLAVAFFSGLRSTAPDMKNTCDIYLDERGFMDVQILSTLGLTEEDIDVLQAQEGIAQVEPAWIVDAYASRDAVDVVTKLYSLPRQLNRLTVLEGRLPTAENECVVDSLLVDRMDLKLGDSLDFRTSGDLEDALDQTHFTVVGVVRSPLYISPERGSSTLGTGQVGAFAYVPESAFALDFYTAAFLTVEGAAEAAAFSPEYDTLVDQVTDALEPLGEERARLRRESLVDEGNAKLADVQAELDEAKADAEKELSDARATLADARKELDDGWAEYQDGKATLAQETADAEQEIADAEQQLKDALVELQDGEQQLVDGQKEYQDGQREYQDGQREYQDGLKEFEDGKAEYEDGFKEYRQGKSELEDGWDEYFSGVRQFNAGEDALAKAKRQLDQGEAAFDSSLSALGVPSAKTLLEQLNREDASGAAHAQLDTQLSGMHSKIDQGIAGVDAQIGSLQADQRRIETRLAEIEALLNAPKPEPPQPEPQPQPEPVPPVDGASWFSDPVTPDPVDPTAALLAEQQQLKQELERVKAGMTTATEERAKLVAQKASIPQNSGAVQAQLNAGRKELDNGWAEYHRGQRRLDAAEAKLDDAYLTLKDGERQLEKGKQELDDAKRELDDAEAQLLDAKRELDDAEAQLADAQRELTDARRDLDEGWAEYHDGLQELDDAKVELTDKVAEAKADLLTAERELRKGEREYQDGLNDYRAGEAEAAEKIADAEHKIGDARRKIADIGDAEWYILNRDANPGYLGFGQDADRMGSLASVFPLLFFLVAALVCLTTMTRMVEEQRVQIGSLKALGYSRWAISRKYLGYGFLPALIGGILGLILGFTLFPKMIFTAYQIMYDVPDIRLSVYPGISAFALLAAIACTTLSSLSACLNTLRDTPAALMRPKAPKAGKRVLLEYIKPLWRRMSFNHKVTARNLLRYQKRFWMTVIGIGGCTALIITGFGLRGSLLASMTVQYDEIFRYTAQAAVSENLLPEERSAIEDYLAQEEDITASLSCRISTITAESDTYSTSAYLEVVDPAKIGDFVNLRSYSGKDPLEVPARGVIIDQKLSELLSIGPGDTFVADGDGRVELTVAAVNENYTGHFLYLSPEYYEEVYGKPVQDNAYLLSFASDDLDFCDRIFTQLMDLHGVLAVNRMLTTRDTYMSAMERVDFVIVIVILSAAALALVVLYNLSNINITERKRELSTIRVLGFYDREVSAYVNRENVVLTFLGILFGLGLGRLLHMWLVRSVEIDLMMFGRETAPQAYLWAALLTLLFSAIVALLSHRKMKSIDMVESLKSAE